MYENYQPLWTPEEDLVLRPGRSVTIPLGAMPADACRLFLTGETAAFDEALSSDGAVYCMAAAANKLNLNMAVQKAGGSDPYTVLTEASGELTEALKGFGLAGAQADTATAVFAREERPCLKVTGIANGRTICILCTALEAWDYIAVITASAPSEEEAEGILACWYPLEER